MTKALVLGVTGQDGSYLAELLLSRGYEVHGMLRRTAQYPENLKYVPKDATLHFGDLTTEHHLCSLIHELKPDEIYNLASQSDVRLSFDVPEYTGDVTGLGVTRLLEAVRKFSPNSKVYQASSSEMFGNPPPPQNETSPMRPNSPYGAAKLYAHNMCHIYRESYGMFVACGILFNHESPRRGKNFVTRKITSAAHEIKAGKRNDLYLGNLEAKRDWGYAPDYVKAMWLMLQQPEPDDFVAGTGEAHSVQEFAEEAFSLVGLDWQEYVKIDPNLYRPVEVNHLLADASKAYRVLGWKPAVTFRELVKIMWEAEQADTTPLGEEVR